jgi:hypothetical protein
MTRKSHARRIHVGTSGWSYAHWKSPFYPEDIADEAMLGYYAAGRRSASTTLMGASRPGSSRPISPMSASTAPTAPTGAATTGGRWPGGRKPYTTAWAGGWRCSATSTTTRPATRPSTPWSCKRCWRRDRPPSRASSTRVGPLPVLDAPDPAVPDPKGNASVTGCP